MKVNAKSLLLSSLTATTAVSGCLSFLFFCLGPCPSFLPPFYQQSVMEWPGALQLLHVTSDCMFFHLFLPFPLGFVTFLEQAARADSAVFMHLSLITWCWASSMMKAIRSSGDISLDVLPESPVAFSAMVIVWKVGQYESGKDDMIIILKRVLAITEPIFNRLSHCCTMS